MVRATIVDKDGIKRGAWSLEEDDKLRAYVQKYGPSKWRQLPSLAGLTRCGKSCRFRWLNYLRPGLKRGNYTNEENDVIYQLQKKYGNKWSTIAAKLPGRTDNEIKNHWNAHLNEQVRPKSESTTQPKPKPKQLIPNVEAKIKDFTDFSSTTFEILESSSFSQQTSTSTSSNGHENFWSVNWEVEDYDHSIYENLWNEPFIWDHENNVGHVLDDSLQYSRDYGMFSPQHETTYDDYVDLFCSLPKCRL